MISSPVEQLVNLKKNSTQNRKIANLLGGVLLHTILLLVTLGCNDKSFTGAENGPQEQAETPPQASGDVASNTSASDINVNWQLSCAGSQPSDDIAEANGIIKANLKGLDTFSLPNSPGKVNSINVSVNGEICAHKGSQKRDIVFAVDISGSMNDNDNLALDENGQFNINGPCNRKKAVTAVYESLKGSSNVRFGLVNFNSAIQYTSQAFYNNMDDLLKNGDGISDLCYYIGGTSYESPLKAARELFFQSGPDTQKEIYFITDGEPNQGDHQEVLSQLKNEGVIIATVMLQGNDQLLRSMASEYNGQVLHRKVDQAVELTQALTSLVVSHSISHAAMRIKYLGSDGNAFALRPEDESIIVDQEIFSDKSYSLSSQFLDANAVKGLSLELEIKSSSSATPSIHKGSLTWQ